MVHQEIKSDSSKRRKIMIHQEIESESSSQGDGSSRDRK